MDSIVLLPFLAACAVALAAMSPAAPAQQSEQEAADGILAKVEARIGTPEARAKVRNIVAKGSCVAAAMPGKMTFAWIHAGPATAKITVSSSAMPGMGFGTMGDWSWSQDPMMGITVREGAEHSGVKNLFAIARRAPWKEIYARAASAGEAEVGGRKAWKLTMTPAAGDAETWYVDRETHDLLRVDLSMPDPMGGRLPMQWLFADFKPVNGVTFPFKRTQKVGAMEIAYVCETIETPETLDAGSAEAPSEVLAARHAPGKAGLNEAKPAGVCEVREVEKQPTATIRLTVKESDISKTLAVVFPEVFTCVQKQGADMSGPPFSRYHSMKDGMIDLEAGIPVTKPINPEGRVKVSELPAGKTAVTWHHGPYQDLPKSCAMLEKWIAGQKLAPASGHWENYWTDPGIEPDPAKWRTQILWPVK